ncbi:ATP-dependent helicase HrpB [Caulobacter sp. S45]|uniref:ATP-dependent helicase HrpB n=1 Tax=Caulobacter sp. S45 TaxID=1641861 RepID=UPI0015751B22|nr:ATP-dependent helicase HrpB [Caulobacter sp. S45]
MLPIHHILPKLQVMLQARNAAVLVAPPGAGKTTVVPLALLEAAWRENGRILVLEPRRLAARAAADRMAGSLAEPVGRTVGYRVRLDARVSAHTRIEVVTEGVFTRMILDDPSLEGVAAVLFDEFHERSLDADLGLALAREAQSLLRENLRLLVMSATLDGARVSALLGDAPVVESLGRAFPVETRYLGRDPAARLEPQVARAVLTALAEESGGVLAFLPGAAEIHRVEATLAERLAGRADVQVHPLYGALSPEAQDRAIAPAPAGMRKVVLATSIAETSLTLEGVRVVVDGGVSRVPRFDPASGLTRLATVRVSRASADQRRGRAGRTQPGVCYRLWDEAETRALTAFGRPEILDSDLSGFALTLAQWGAKSTTGLALLDPPPPAAFSEARRLLQDLGALDEAGELTGHGRRLAALPAPPRLAHLMVRGAELGTARRAAHIAMLLTERGLGGESVDLDERLGHFALDGSARAREGRALAERQARQASAGTADGRGGPVSDGVLLALAYPERIAKARGADGVFNLTTGRAVRVDPSDALAREPWLAVGELGGGAASDRVRLAARIDRAELEQAFAEKIVEETRTEVDPDGRVRARRMRRLGTLVLDQRRLDQPSPDVLCDALAQHLRSQGLMALPLGEDTQRLRDRIAFLARLDPEGGWPDLSDATLLATAEDWLGEQLGRVSRLADLAPGDVHQAIMAGVDYAHQRRLDVEAPVRLTLPTGSSPSIDYAAEGGPRVEARVQELFGMKAHPTVAQGRVSLTLALLSPARRPVQVTRDLPGFWAGSWNAVRSEMKGRYPRHPWPEDPSNAAPTTRAKPRGT